MDTSLSEIHHEIQRNLEFRPDVQEARILFAGSIYAGVTDVYLRLEASRRCLRLTSQAGSFDDAKGDVVSNSEGNLLDGVVLAPFFDLIIEDFEARVMEFSDAEIGLIERQFIEKWKVTLASVPATARVVVLGLHPLRSAYPYWKSRKSEVIDRFNTQLRDLVKASLGATFLDLEAVIFELGREHAINQRMYLTARMPYTPKLSKRLAPLILDALKIGQTLKKVLVLDCDNTIWGGVLDEDGFDGIHLDSNTPKGRMFQSVQRQIVELQKLGMLICLVSKNDERSVLNVLDCHESQILRREHIISWRINWEPKSDNLKSLASELNLDLSSFVFVDDSEFECAEVSQLLPDIEVRLAPTESESWSQLLSLLKRGLLQGSREMLSPKTAEYKVRQEIEGAKILGASEFEFLSTLNIELKSDINQIGDLTRLAEMFLKTNQFNTTGIRRSEREISSLIAQPESLVISFRVTDKFTNHGLVSAVIARLSSNELHVTDWLMSCRVLGRRIEYGIASLVGEIALSRSCTVVRILLNQSPKNGRAIKFLEEIAEACDVQFGFEGCVVDARDLVSLRPEWMAVSV